MPSSPPPLEIRHFTPAEVAELIPRLKPLLAALQAAWHDHGFARDQHEDILRMHEGQLPPPPHPDHEEAARWRAEEAELARRVEGLAQEVRALGAELKDPAMGLVDFYAKRGDETVLLCFRADEATLGHWHPLVGGYQARRPLSEF